MDITFASISSHVRGALQALGGASFVIATTLALGLPASLALAGA